MRDTQLTRVEIAAMDDEQLECVMYGIASDIYRSQADSAREFFLYPEKYFRQLPVKYQLFLLLNTLVFEIYNGGFIQYFRNNRGKHNSETLAALSMIGAKHHAKVFVQAIKAFELEIVLFQRVWEMEEVDNEQATELSCALYEERSLSALRKCDTQFYNVDDKVPMHRLVARYVRTHLDEYFPAVDNG